MRIKRVISSTIYRCFAHNRQIRDDIKRTEASWTISLDTARSHRMISTRQREIGQYIHYFDIGRQFSIEISLVLE